MPEDMDASAGRPDAPALLLDDSESNATPTTLSEASTAPGVPLRTVDVGVFENAPEYSTAANSVSASQTTKGGVPGRPREWMAYAVFVVLVLMALLIRLAVSSASPVTSNRVQTNSSISSPETTATPSSGITPNATLPETQGGHTAPTPGPETPFAVTSAWISVSPTTTDVICDSPQTSTEEFQGLVYVPGTTPGGTVTYRWRMSNGTVTPTQSVLIGPTNRPAYYVAANDQLIKGQWAMDPATADGSRKWAEFEILTPSHLLSPPGYFWYKCEFLVRMTSASVSGGSGGTPPQYNCPAGGDQTFTFTGTISAFADAQSHTVTYHWLRADGTQGADLSVTFSPGQLSASVQPDTVVVTYAQAQANGGRSLSEKIVVTSVPDITAYPADFLASCPA